MKRMHWCELYVDNSVEEVVKRIRGLGIEISYLSDSKNPEFSLAIAEGIIIISACERWRSLGIPFLLNVIPSGAEVCVQLVYGTEESEVLRKILQQTLTVISTRICGNRSAQRAASRIA